MIYLKTYEAYAWGGTSTGITSIKTNGEITTVNLYELYDETKEDNDHSSTLVVYPTFENIVEKMFCNNIIEFKCFDCRTTHKGYCLNVNFLYNRHGNAVDGFDRIELEIKDLPENDHSIDMIPYKQYNSLKTYALKYDANVIIFNKETSRLKTTKQFDL